MASIKKRPNGMWRARYRDPAGREVARHFARKVDAQRWVDEATTALVTGQYVDPAAGKVTFRDYAEQWRTAAPHGPATQDKVRRSLERHVYPTFGRMAMRSVRPTSVQAWVTALPLAPSTARVMLSYVIAIFRAAVRDRVIVASPAEGIRPPTEGRAEVYIPEPAQLEVLRGRLPERYRAVLDLVVGAGLRQGEVFGLEVDGLDFLAGRELEVRQQLRWVSPDPVHLAPPKTVEAERTIPLAQVTLDALAAHLAAWPARRVAIPDRTDRRRREPRQKAAQLVFTTEHGQPMTRPSWSMIWQPAARAAGIPERVGLHALRHYYASALIHHGESVKVVQRRLGHSSATTTLNTYAHLWPDSDDRTRQAVEAAVVALSASAPPHPQAR
ncbi:tyrosine-type recombinase/integrase [Pseudonocardia kongjuensis]|uniref:Tyrosine-type recombinase/integrase n=1 Tax=Pseudonocardia kongjuensis TaxID=102227 RepID=A0ABN1Y6S4_9PSEU